MLSSHKKEQFSLWRKKVVFFKKQLPIWTDRKVRILLRPVPDF